MRNREKYKRMIVHFSLIFFMIIFHQRERILIIKLYGYTFTIVKVKLKICTFTIWKIIKFWKGKNKNEAYMKLRTATHYFKIPHYLYTASYHQSYVKLIVNG